MKIAEALVPLNEGRKSNILKILSQLHAYLKRYQDLDKAETHFEQRLKDAGCEDIYAVIDDVQDIVDTAKAKEKARLLNRVYKEHFPKTAKEQPASDEEIEEIVGDETRDEFEEDDEPQEQTLGEFRGGEEAGATDPSQGGEGKTFGDIRKPDAEYLEPAEDDDYEFDGAFDDDEDFEETIKVAKSYARSLREIIDTTKPDDGDLGDVGDFEEPERNKFGTRHPQTDDSLTDEAYEYIEELKFLRPEMTREEIVDNLISEFSSAEYQLDRTVGREILDEYEDYNDPANEEATSGEIQTHYEDLIIDGVPDSIALERLSRKYKLSVHELQMMLGENRISQYEPESNLISDADEYPADDTEEEGEEGDDDFPLDEGVEHHRPFVETLDDELGDVGDFEEPQNQDIVFDSTEDFKAIDDARAWLKSRGYSLGTMCGDAPMGFKQGQWNIAKWFNLDMSDTAQLDGCIISKNFRNGPVKIKFGNAARASQDLESETPEGQEAPRPETIIKLRFKTEESILPDNFQAIVRRTYDQLAAGRNEEAVINDLIDKGYTDKTVNKVFDYLAFKNPLKESLPGPSDQHAGQPTQEPVAAPPTPYNTAPADLGSTPPAENTNDNTNDNVNANQPAGTQQPDQTQQLLQNPEFADFFSAMSKINPNDLSNLTQALGQKK